MSNVLKKTKAYVLGLVLGFIILLMSGFSFMSFYPTQQDTKILSYEVNLQAQTLRFYWKDDQSKIFKNFKTLKAWLESKNKTLVFATNGGMYKTDNSPLGLYIEDKKSVTALNTFSGKGNFYVKPNGVFYITGKKEGFISQTSRFKNTSETTYATQSGPMLVIDGNIHPAFKKGSDNLNIRNGVGILESGNVVFAMSKEPINFHDFATYFKTLGCKNALYLDGYVSRTYLPEKNWIQTDGNFGVILAVTRN